MKCCSAVGTTNSVQTRLFLPVMQVCFKKHIPFHFFGHLESGQGVALPTSNRFFRAGSGCLCTWGGSGKGWQVGMDLLLEDAAWVSEVNSPVTFNKSKCWAQSAESTALRVWTRAAISTTASVAGVLGRLVILIILSQDARFKAMAASLPTPHPTPPHPRLLPLWHR